MAVDPKKAPLEYQKKLGFSVKKRAIAALIISEKLTTLFIDELVPTEQPEQDYELSLLWGFARGHYQEFETVIQIPTMLAMLEDHCEKDPDMLDDDVELYYELIGYITDCKADPVDHDWAVKTLKDYLAEIRTSDLREQIQAGNAIVADLARFLSNNQDAVDRVNSIGLSGSSRLFQPGWQSRTVLQLRTTTFPWMDELMDGGEAPKEVYGIIAPFGTCKTTTANQAVVNKATNAYTKFEVDNHNGIELTVLVAYETPAEETRYGMLGYSAEIPRWRLKELGSIEDYSHNLVTMRDYEKNLAANLALAQAFDGDMTVMRSELDRSRDLEALDDFILFLNAVEDVPNKPGQERVRKLGLSDIAFAIEKRCEELQKKYPNVEIRVGSIYIDYVNAGIKNMMNLSAEDWSTLRMHIASFPINCKTKLAIPFNSSIYLYQQFNGQAQRIPYAAPMHHSLAGECTTFAENLAFCLCIGNKSPESLVAVQATKTRRGPLKDPIVIRIDGAMNRVLYEPDMRVNFEQRTFVNVSEEAAVEQFS